jgi:DnaK suppressor protein
MTSESSSTPPELDHLEIKSGLLDQRSEILGRLSEMKKPPERGSAIGFGKRIGDGTSEAASRITEVALANDLEVTVARIERALEKIDQGSYGICDVCDQPIAPGRLKVLRQAHCASSVPAVKSDHLRR